MAELKWIKVLTGVLNDRKIQKIKAMPEGRSLVLMWFYLLTEAGKTNEGGWIFLPDDPSIPYSPADLAKFWDETQQNVEIALQVYQRFGLIEIDDLGRIFISNWDKHQSMERIESRKERDKLRKREERARKKLALLPPSPANVSTEKVGQSADSPDDVHGPSRRSPHTERERERELELDKESFSLSYTADQKESILRTLNQYNVKCKGTFELEQVESYLGVMSIELILDAIKRSEKTGVPYLREILKEWLKKGYRQKTDHPDYQPKGEDDNDGGPMGKPGGDRKRSPGHPPSKAGIDVTKGKTGRIPFEPR